MEESFKNKLGFWTFFLIVISLLVGGYYLTNYLSQEDVDKEEYEEKEKQDYRIDKDKEYIYFKNEEVISEGAEIYYKDVVINLSTQSSLTEILEKENKIYKDNIKYISDEEGLTEELINYNNDNLYALTFREYDSYEYDNYVSLVIRDYNYSCFDLATFVKTKSYIFDISNGNLLSEEDILNKYSLDINSLKDRVRVYLESKQQVVEEENLIKIDETLNDFNNYSLYINEYGRLYISYLVKTIKEDYNEVMEVL